MKHSDIDITESAVVLNASAVRALVVNASADFLLAQDAAKEAARLEIAAINHLRSAGEKIQEACGHEQPDFAFWKNHESELPAGMTFKAIKFCVHLANNIKEPVKTLDEAKAARQMVFVMLGEASQPHRLERQTPHERNIWNEFVSDVSGLTALFAKLGVDDMVDWGRDRLESFVATTEPVVKQHERAKQLLSK